MTIKGREHYEMMEMFEKTFPHMRLDREESKERWAKGNVYQDDRANSLFIAYRHGVSYGRATA